MNGATRASLIISAVMLISGWFASRDPRWFALNAVSLLLVYTIPALRIHDTADLRRRWKGLMILMLVGTLAWDYLDSQIRAVRPFLGAWYIVYPSSPVFFFGLYWVHARLAKRLELRRVPE
jgi:hypothetical protein